MLRFLFCISTMFFMGASCRKKAPEKVETEKTIELTPPEKTIQVISVMPDEIESGVSAKGLVRGSGFESGAEVFIADQAANPVDFEDESKLSIVIPSLAEGSYDLKVVNPDGDAHTLRSAILVQAPKTLMPEGCSQFTIYFGLDQASINNDLKALLSEKADCFSPEFNYRVEGHCDERGTTEYNMALGVKRSRSIQQYIQGQGVLSDRIETISYGEERPETSGSNEQAWAKNRRVVIIVSE